MLEVAPEKKRPQIELTFTDKDLELLMQQKEGEGKLGNTVVVVIDVLRFTSHVAGAFTAGAGRIIPVTSSKEAFRVASRLRAQGQIVVVAAEQGGSRVSGADRGNSPRYEPGFMDGKVLVISTSHGTHTLHAAHRASEVVLASFLNAPKVIDHLRQTDKDVILATSGSKYPGEEETVGSKDDCLVAAMISKGLTENQGIHELPERQLVVQDARRRVYRVLEIYPTLMMAKLNAEMDREGAKEVLLKTRWALHLLDLDRRHENRENQEDIDYLSQVGFCDLVPVLNPQGKVVPLK